MLIITGEHGSGKTKKLMLSALQEDATIVCKCPQRMEEKARAYGITGVKFASYAEYPNIEGNLYIDDLDEWLTTLNPHITGFDLSID